MATKQLISNYFRLHNVKQFRESVNETANSVYYVFAGYHVPYPSGDSVVPTITNTVEETFRNSYRNMVFGKRVGTADVNAMVPLYMWTANTAYKAYRSDEDLSNAQFYVITNEGSFYRFFKCLDNNGNNLSTVSPAFIDTSANASFYQTSDGYIWKYVASVSSVVFTKFSTPAWAPIVVDANVSGNAISGAIDVVKVNFPGSNYNTFFANVFTVNDLRVGGDATKYNLANNASASNGFYTGSFLYITGGTGFGQGKTIVDYIVVGSSKLVTVDSAFSVALDVSSTYEITPSVSIIGDGSNAVARAIVNNSVSNSVASVQIIQRGKNYSFANLTVVGNTGGVTNSATLQAVFGPKGGHGFDVEYELGTSAIAVSVAFSNSESNTIPVKNDYREIGLLKDPLFANVVYTVASVVGKFTIGETVTQSSSNSSAIVNNWDNISVLSLANVSGIFTLGTPVVGQTSGASANLQSFVINGTAKNFNTFDQRQKFTYTVLSGVFVQDEIVFQGNVAVTNAVFHSNDATYIYLTNVKGTLGTGNTIVGATSGASANLVTSFPADLTVGSGEVIYIENINPISRGNSQSEQIKFILEF